MSKQNKADFLAVLPTLIKDGSSKEITPIIHRSVITNKADSVGWLEDANTWEAAQYFTGGIRMGVYSGADITKTLSTETLHVITGAVATGRTLPASMVTGKLYIIKNRGTTDVTITRGSNGLFTFDYLDNFILVPGSQAWIVGDGTYWSVLN
jgi:hypothetical protein